MNYSEIIDDIVNNFEHPCDKEVPQGYYRRVKWELYNPNKEQKQPANREEWDTEIIKVGTRLYKQNPFGLRSDPIPDPPDEEGNTNQSLCKGVYSSKLGVCFVSQTALEEYVESIGSELLPNNDWYGADLSKSDLFKTLHERSMYEIENAGGTWGLTGNRIDKRTMMMISKDDKIVKINFNGLGNSRNSYLRHYEDKPCTYVGIRLNLNPDLSIPPVPPVEPINIDGLPPELFRNRAFGLMNRSAIGCIPVSAGYPYSDIGSAIVEAWGETRHSFKLYVDSLPSMTQKAEGYAATMYDHLSVSMEELGKIGLAIAQYTTQQAFMVFKSIISQAMNIVGGGWDMFKRFLPSINLMGISIDIEDIFTAPDGFQKLKDMLSSYDAESVISSINSIIGTGYDYAVEYVKMYSRDLIDAISDLYDYFINMILNGCVAMANLLGKLAEIWAIPPELPNPVHTAIVSVNQLFSRIEPLSLILGGGFPNFTAQDIYQQVQEYVKSIIDNVRNQIDGYLEQLSDIYQKMKDANSDLSKKKKSFKQYLSGMKEYIEDETTRLYEESIEQANSIYEDLKNQYEIINSNIDNLKNSINDVLQIAIDKFKDIPIVSTISKLLGLLGMGIESFIDTIKNNTLDVETVYKNFSDATRTFKDMCVRIYNQVSTIALSKVAQWVNKLLQIIGLNISFPQISLCIPYLKY